MIRGLEGRAPATVRVGRCFASDHPFGGVPAEVSAMFAVLAESLLEVLPDGPDLAAVLRRLLEAADVAVQAAVAAEDEVRFE